ncbi:MAG TPA: ABC transporter permease [Chloroflexota bacterium]|nr:ABC transporter permease [Chloroflexota bacterium]
MIQAKQELATVTIGAGPAVLGQRRSARRRHIFLELNFVLPMAIILLLVIAAIFAPQLAPWDPLSQSLEARMAPPVFAGGTSAHLLGTDRLGRDILSRVIWGARISLVISLAVILITSTVGTVLAIVAGYVGGWLDGLIMRITDIFFAVPGILLAILMAVILGPSVKTLIIALSIVSWAPYTRQIRGEVLQVRESGFVAQAKIIGCSPVRIMATHIFPNIVNTLLVLATLFIGIVILAEAGLSFLGAGVPPPTPAWGSMVTDGRDYVQTAWWISFFPGLAIGLVVLAFNFLGDWLRDKLDPRLRQI